ncbi:DNA (cytosine-5-)-methyltransferase 3 beta, duplicate a [Sardina pilchardus]|uniref:DNA (cytosine-5-)-methyltransferase 3 beta, duplicate a n=1 Tax=Sardina pilchardus TaxID=27697 RepID=UPI002E0FBCE0
MATNVSLDGSMKENLWSSSDVLKWLNKTLQTEFNQVEQTRSGACYCQLMHCLFPKSIDLEKVKFQEQEREEFIHNYHLLQESFVKNGVNRVVPVEELVKGRFKTTFYFLKWFKKFFAANNSEQKYNPVRARKGANMVLARRVRFSKSDEPADRNDSVVIESDSEEDTRAKRTTSVYNGEWQTTFNWVKPSNLGQNYAFCSICDINLCIQYSGEFDLRRHQKSKTHVRNQRKSSGGNITTDATVSASVALMQFIQTLVSEHSGENNQASQHRAKLVLGPHYPEDIKSVCNKTPYCVYLYGAVAAGQQTLVVLVGFFDDKAVMHRFRFLDAFQTSGNNSEEAVVTFLMETFKKFDITSQNMCAFYMDGLGDHSQKIASELKQLSPHIVALGGLYSLPDAACQAGVTEHFHEAKELILKIHAHYTTLSSGNDDLKALFAGVHELDQAMTPQTTPCQAFTTIVRRVDGMWQELVSYFSKDASGEDKSMFEEICTQLKNPKLRVMFMFLDNALEPLRSFQDRLEKRNGTDRADLVQILREASGLLRAYASSFLRPHAVMRFLKERNAALLTDTKFYLSAPELNLGGTAVEDFLLEHEADMTDFVQAFQTKCLSFYATLTASLAEGLPLSDGVLRSMSQLLSPEGRLKVTENAVTDLAAQLGLTSTPEESLKITGEFLQYQLAEEQKGKTKASGGESGPEDECLGSSSTLSLEEHWGTYLKTTDPTSSFRKLVLSLLALPCPPLEAKKVFAQAASRLDSSHSDDRMVSDTEVMKVDVISDGSHSDSVSSPIKSGRKTKSPSSRKVSDRAFSLRPCSVQLQRMTKLGGTDDVVIVEGDDAFSPSTKGGGVRGLHVGSLRQRPAVRTVFQASTGTWAKPKSLEIKNAASSTASPTASSTPSPTPSPVKRGPRRGSPTSTPISPSPRPRFKRQLYQDGLGFSLGELIWGKGKDFSWWPGLVVLWKGRSAPVGMRRVEWFGDGLFSEIQTGGLLPFAAFAKCFCTNSYASLPLYKNAIYQVLEVAGERCGKSFSAESGDKANELMLVWAFGGFLPTGPDGFQPPSDDNPKDSDSSMSDYQPPAKRKHTSRNNYHIEPEGRELILHKVTSKGKKIESLCISCGDSDAEVLHPLFEGSLCGMCKKNFMETLYRYDEDGYQSYCTVCCFGKEVLLCSNSNCCRCFCKDCLNFLVGPGTFEELKEVEPWSCYMCCPPQRFGVLKRRPDWNARVQELFANNGIVRFEPQRVYPSIPAHLRRPIRVLSIFDGIATGYVVLKELGFNIDLYLASEILDDVITEGAVKQNGKIGYIKDVRTITRRNLTEWGPFDLLIGRSRCSDVSVANRNQQGIGRQFFEYYRMLTMMRPRDDDDRPFFWLFENKVAMSADDRSDISRFLESNPIMIDAANVNPAHKTRFFWGNLPGMSRSMAVSQSDRVNLQDSLEIGQMATFNKVKTMSPNSNSIKQGKMGPLPVNGKDDFLWCSELDKVLPKQYTDVANMGRGHQQKFLGHSWSVPVIRHLLAPLKDYFACE